MRTLSKEKPLKNLISYAGRGFKIPIPFPLKPKSLSRYTRMGINMRGKWPMVRSMVEGFSHMQVVLYMKVILLIIINVGKGSRFI